jgi:transcriptional regulator with XRE-family HTH domain
MVFCSLFCNRYLLFVILHLPCAYGVVYARRSLVLEVKRLRLAREWNQTELAFHAGLAPSVISEIENGKRDPSARTLRKLAEALKVDVADLFPKGQAPLPDFEDEWRADWRTAVREAHRLRETGSARMWKALSEWSASKKRGEPRTARREYLDEMGNLLQEAYAAYTALGWAYVQAAITRGGSEASVPSSLQEETGKAHDFYVEMFGQVRSVRLTIRTDTVVAAAKRAEKPQPEVRPHEVEESDAA